MHDYKIVETEDYTELEELFIEAGLEITPGEGGEKCWGLLGAYKCLDAEGRLIAAVSVARRKEHFLICDLAVESGRRGEGIGSWLVDIALEDLARRGAREVYLATKAPIFFEKCRFSYLEESEVPKIFACLGCRQYKRSCMPRFMRIELS